MFEWHGWATIRDRSTYDEFLDATSDPAEATLAKIRQILAESERIANETADLRAANGDWHVWLAGFHNHRAAHVVPVFEAIAEAAPGSYGLLNVHDDEAEGSEDQWFTWAMARGRVQRHNDQFLSPHVGVVEGP